MTLLLATRVTRMNHWQGFAANAVSAALVGAGAAFGLPMSTTPCLRRRDRRESAAEHGAAAAERRTLRDMVLAWVVTLPAAALLGVIVYVGARLLLRR